MSDASPFPCSWMFLRHPKRFGYEQVYIQNVSDVNRSGKQIQKWTHLGTIFFKIHDYMMSGRNEKNK